MKKSHLFAIILIVGAIAIIVLSGKEASTYATFDEAYALATGGSERDIHVVGALKKDADGEITGIETGADRVSFSFLLLDDKGKEQKVFYAEPMPADFLRSEKVVVIGRYSGDSFVASKILLKCPSKYQEEKINAGI
jgi:cytochrome c-type biogenesis protein CcmE